MGVPSHFIYEVSCYLSQKFILSDMRHQGNVDILECVYDFSHITVAQFYNIFNCDRVYIDILSLCDRHYFILCITDRNFLKFKLSAS